MPTLAQVHRALSIDEAGCSVLNAVAALRNQAAYRKLRQQLNDAQQALAHEARLADEYVSNWRRGLDQGYDLSMTSLPQPQQFSLTIVQPALSDIPQDTHIKGPAGHSWFKVQRISKDIHLTQQRLGWAGWAGVSGCRFVFASMSGEQLLVLQVNVSLPYLST